MGRNTGTAESLDVKLHASEEGCVKIPVVVTIPEGMESVAFTVEGLPNSEVKDDRRIFLSAEADGFGKAFASLNLTDRSIPDARIIRVEGLGRDCPSVASGSLINICVTLSNQGTTELPELTLLTVYVDGNVQPVARMWTQEPLLVGNEVDLTASLNIPDLTGSTFFRILVNESRTVQELDYSNNIHSISVYVTSPYSAKVTTDKSLITKMDLFLMMFLGIPNLPIFLMSNCAGLSNVLKIHLMVGYLTI